MICGLGILLVSAINIAQCLMGFRKTLVGLQCLFQVCSSLLQLVQTQSLHCGLVSLIGPPGIGELLGLNGTEVKAKHKQAKETNAYKRYDTFGVSHIHASLPALKPYYGISIYLWVCRETFHFGCSFTYSTINGVMSLAFDHSGCKNNRHSGLVCAACCSPH